MSADLKLGGPQEKDAAVDFGFASFSDGRFELIVRNRKTWEETTLKGTLEPGQFELADRILPTCVYVVGIPAAGTASTEPTREALELARSAFHDQGIADRVPITLGRIERALAALTHPAPAAQQNEPVAWLVPSDETGLCRIWWRDKERAEAWVAKHPDCTLIPLYAAPPASSSPPGMRKALEKIADGDWGYISPEYATDKSRIRTDKGRGNNVPYMGEWAVIARRALSTPPSPEPATRDADLCAGGVDPGWDECPKCGATSDDPCRFSMPEPAASALREEHSPAGSSPELEAILKDPAAVHLNMLRGGIAMPSLENIKHLYPEVRDAFAAVEKKDLDLVFCREAMRHADIDLSMILPEVADRDMQKEIRKTLDRLDEAKNRSLSCSVPSTERGQP